MKNKSLLPILLLAALTLGACNLGGQSSQESKEEPATSESQPTTSEDTTQYSVEIANKAALQGEWYAGTNRDLDVTLTPAANPLSELGKNLTVTSSDAEVVAVTGLGLSALKAGTATITVKYHEVTDTVEVTILDNSAKGKYGVAHEGTAADPFTNEDALAVAKSEKYEGEVYYVKGKVASFYNAPGSRTDGMVAYFLEPATAGGEKFEIYKCFKEDGSPLTDDDIWVGGEATAYGAFTKYNSQYETSSAKFVKCEGNKPQARQTLTKTFAEVLAAGAALADGADTYDYLKFQGYVTKKSGNDFYLTATKGEALVEATSDADHGSKKYYSNAIELYGVGSNADIAAKLLEDAKVEVTMVVKNYHGTVENGLTLTADSITVIEAGHNWSVPEPAVGNKTIAEFIALENTKAKAYVVEGTVKDWGGATAEKSQFGNMTLTDGTNDLVIYGASATATALAWDNSEAYAFTNPKDFLTNETTAALNVGDTVTMKLIRADYTKDGVTTIQGTGVITKVTPAGQQVNYTLIEKFDFASSLTAYEAYNADKMNAFIKGSSSLGENTNYVSHVNGKDADSTLTDPLIGANGKWSNVNWSNYNNLKLGSTSKNCKITLNFKDGTAISKVVVKAAGWNGKTCKLGVNGGDQVTIASAGTSASMEDETAFQTYTFELATPAKDLVLETTLAVMISEMELYAIEGGVAPQPEIAQPTGTFFASAEITDTGKAALSTTNSIVPVFITLGAENAVSVSINGTAVAATLKSYDKTNGNLVITTASFGDLSMTFNPETGDLEKLSVVAATGVLKYDGGQSLRGNDKLKYWNCDGSTEELQAQFVRRYNSPWTADTGNADRVVKDEANFKSGSGAKVRAWKDGRIALAVKDFDAKFNARNLSFWVYNPGEADISLQAFAYKSAGYADYIQVFSGKTAVAGQWTYISVGFTPADVYAFQIVVPNGTSTQLTFDDICLF